MKTSLAQAKTVLGIEIGSANTRGFLFDVVENRYRLIASSTAQSTHAEPVFDIGDAISEVVINLQEISGRVLLEKSGGLILPTQSSGEGAGPPLVRTWIVDLSTTDVNPENLAAKEMYR